jgi:hypothetical protein
MRPTRIIAEPFIDYSTKARGIYMIPTDIGVLPLAEVAKLVGLGRAKLYHRLFSSQNTRWDAKNIFAESIPKTRIAPRLKMEIEPSKARPRVYKEVTNKRKLTWEERDYIWTKGKMERTLRRLPAQDRDYNDALKYNRAVAG